MRSLMALIIMLAMLPLPAIASRSVVEQKVFVRGRVLDPLSKPVPDAKILLRNADSGEIVSQSTGKKGEFSVQHALCSHVSLDVVADEKTRLTRAQYGKLNGRETKNVIIRLQRGFLITGKVVAHAKGVRDVDVLVVPLGKHNPEEAIFGGGLARTARDGSFRLVLTPGQKLLKFVNNERSDLAAVTEHKIVVTEDGALPDFELKAQQPGK